MAEERQTAEQQVRRLYEEGEQRTAAAMEELVGRQAFGEILARVTENVMALTRIGYEAMDLAVRNFRLAGRQDVARLGRQLARTEDKLEMVLQHVERLEERLDQSSRSGSSGGGGSGSRSSRSGKANSRSSRGGASAGSGSSSGNSGGRSSGGGSGRSPRRSGSARSGGSSGSGGGTGS